MKGLSIVSFIIGFILLGFGFYYLNNAQSGTGINGVMQQNTLSSFAIANFIAALSFIIIGSKRWIYARSWFILWYCRP